MPTEISGSTGVNKIQSSAIEYGDLPTGSVLQVVHSGTTTAANISSSSFSTIGLSASITPKSTSSKILITTNLSVTMGSWQGNDHGMGVQITRGGSQIYANVNEYIFAYYNNANSSSTSHVYQRPSMSFLDSPSTTSAITYEIKVGAYENKTIGMQAGSGRSDLTLIEVAG